MRAVFCVSGGLGHLHPMVPLARGLCARGADVVVATRPSFAPVVERIGLPTRPVHGDERGASTRERFDADLGHTAGLDRSRLSITLLLDRAAALVPEIVDIVDASGGDVLVREATRCCIAGNVMSWASWLAGAVLDRPVVTVDLGAAPRALLTAVAADHFDRVRSALGLTEDPGLVTLDGALRLLGGPPGWFPASWLSGSTRLFQPPDFDAGGGIDDRPEWLGRHRDRPAVYATLGTEDHGSPETFGVVFEALAGEDVDVIATVGPRVDPASLGRVPPNVSLHRYLRQSLVLPQCDAVVAHGGYGTLMGALLRGRPVVALPSESADNQANATRIAALGVGLIVAQPDRSAAAVRTAVRALLADPGFGRRACEVAAATRRLPPIEEAARLVEQLVSASPHRPSHAGRRSP